MKWAVGLNYTCCLGAGTATGYNVDCSGFENGWRQEIIYSPHSSRQTLVPIGVNFPGVQRSERGAEHRPHPTPMLRMSRATPLLPLCASTVCYSETLTVFIIVSSRLYDITLVRVFLPLMQTIKPVRMSLIEVIPMCYEIFK